MRSGSPLFVKIDATMPSLDSETMSDELTDSASPKTPEDEHSLTVSWPDSENTIRVAPAPLRRTETAPSPRIPVPIRSAPLVLPKPHALRAPPGPSPLGRAKPLLAADLAASARPARVLQLVCAERRADAVARLETFATRRSKVAPAATWQTTKLAAPAEPRAPVVRAKARVYNTEIPLSRRTPAMIQLYEMYQMLKGN